MAAQVLAGLAGAAGASGGLLATIYKIIYGERAWKKFAPSEKEKMDYEDEINDENADLAYIRQRQFQENYLSPAAQLSSLAAGYDSIGLNRMSLVGANPGVTSSSVPQAASPSSGGSPSLPSGIGDVFSSLLSYSNEKKRIDNDYKLRDRQLDIDSRRLQMQELYYKTLGGYYGSKTTAQENENSIFGLRKQDLETNIQQKEANINQITQWITESGSRVSVNNQQASLLFKEANYTDVLAAGQEIQNQILAAQSKYSDQYFKAVAKIQECQSNIASFDSAAVKQYWNKKLLAYEKELQFMIDTAKEKSDWVNSDAWDKICQGRLNHGEKAQMWTGVVKSVVSAGVAAGAVVGSAAIRANAFGGFALPGTLPRQFTMTPSL